MRIMCGQMKQEARIHVQAGEGRGRGGGHLAEDKSLDQSQVWVGGGRSKGTCRADIIHSKIQSRLNNIVQAKEGKMKG